MLGSAVTSDEEMSLATLAEPFDRPIIYTAITGNYDVLKEQPHAVANEATFIAFVDEPKESRTWRTYAAHSIFADANRNAKIHKVLSHRYFPAARYSLWIDGAVTIRLATSIQRLIDTNLADCDLAVFRHRVRICIYQEASVCLQRRLDDPEVIWQQICRYTRAGYPSNAGLAECTVILRRHTPLVEAFNEAWWAEITRGSRRDQLSFDYVARKLGLRYGLLPGTIADNPWFHRGTHTHGEPVPAASNVQSSGEPQAPFSPAPLAAPPVVVGQPADAPASSVRSPRYYRSASVIRRRKTIAFGRIREQPSWNWVGFDVARELSKDYEVILYDSSSRPPPCDVLFHVKKRLSEVFVSRAQQNGTKLVYCPIDVYQTPLEIESDGDLLRSCATVLTHCERLLPLLRRYCTTQFVEHHARYALTEMADYKERGFILWIGRCQYLPYLLRWLERHPIEYELKILTDIDNDRGRALAVEYAAEIGISIEMPAGATSIAGYRVHRWSERRQQEMMRACKAALDVKMTQFFHQYHKPPTKAQKYVASGIPCAVNPDSYSAEYFSRVRDFAMASPLDTERWLSRDYWEATRLAGERLRADTSLEAVATRYRELIESL